MKKSSVVLVLAGVLCLVFVLHVSAEDGDFFHAPPEPWFTFSPSAPRPGEAVHFIAAQTGDDRIVSYQWDTSGDGIYDDAGSKTSYTYASFGRYPVTLTIHDGLGRSTSVTRHVWVRQGGVQLTIRSEPSDLTVYIDGEIRGRTPLELIVESGKRHVRLRHYWLGEWESEIDLRKLDALTLEVTFP